VLLAIFEVLAIFVKSGAKSSTQNLLTGAVLLLAFSEADLLSLEVVLQPLGRALPRPRPPGFAAGDVAALYWYLVQTLLLLPAGKCCRHLGQKFLLVRLARDSGSLTEPEMQRVNVTL
jgi:hypothetical protein